MDEQMQLLVSSTDHLRRFLACCFVLSRGQRQTMQRHQAGRLTARAVLCSTQSTDSEVVADREALLGKTKPSPKFLGCARNELRWGATAGQWSHLPTLP